MDREIYQDRDGNQNDAKPEREGKVSLSNLKRDCCRQDPGEMINITPDNHDCPDLPDPASEPGKRRGQKAASTIPK